ncbi:MAG TPA: SRPBCC family protein [Candidatus Baltobacteraceae bacterium]|nr:SRPBCC family protein [Candidatus Baltobacteraceae bacterium]
MKAYGKSRSTTASPERVWAVWSDPNNWSRWNSGIRACELSGPLADGTLGKMETTRGSKHTVTFAGVEPPRRFTLSMSGPPLATITFICEVEPSGFGSTVSQSVAFSGPLAFVFGPMLGEQMADHFVPVLDDLAAAAEAT